MDKKYNLGIRLSRLEEYLKVQRAAGIWVDMDDNKVRIDVNHNHGEGQTCPSVYDAGQYVQRRVNEGENVNGVICVSDICDLFPDSAEIKDAVLSILERELAVVFFLTGIKEQEGTFDIAFCALVSACWYFNTVGFHQRFKSGEWSEEDEKMFDALFLIYSHYHSRLRGQ